MSQSSALREQPSMDEILASIRKIIDSGESQMKPAGEEFASPAVTIPPSPANDSHSKRQPAPQSILPQAPLTQRTEETDPAEADMSSKGINSDLAAVVDAYLAAENTARAPETEDGKREEASSQVEVSAGNDMALTAAPASDGNAMPQMDDDVETGIRNEAAAPEPEKLSVSSAEAELLEEFSAIDRDLLADRQAKYDARFSETDDGVFRKVGSLLRETVEPSAAVAGLAGGGRSTSLVSDAVSRSVSQSLASLSGMVTRDQGPDLDAMAEEMLRPMLQDWLDNNLPSLVERLVRAEIERIARGEPRVA